MSTETKPLPKREKYTEAELKQLALWMDDHGDPQEWPESVRLAYANTIADMRAGGTL